MLIIRRRGGEAILIGEDVEIQILEINGNQVKLGINAPRQVSVLRAEVLPVSQQNRAAAGAPNQIFEDFFKKLSPRR